jgi:hypothetical protein
MGSLNHRAIAKAVVSNSGQWVVACRRTLILITALVDTGIVK